MTPANVLRTRYADLVGLFGHEPTLPVWHMHAQTLTCYVPDWYAWACVKDILDDLTCTRWRYPTQIQRTVLIRVTDVPPIRLRPGAQTKEERCDGTT